jgi:acyl carrier protein
MTQDVAAAVKQYILDQFLPGEDPGALLETTPLITNGILDSLATLQLVAFLEEHFGIEIAAHETGVDYLNTIADITALVRSKQQA